MKKTGSLLALIGGVVVVIMALLSIFNDDFRAVWQMEFSSVEGFVYVAVILAIMISVLAFLSFSSKPRLLGLIILAASFAGIIVGSTFMDIAMLLCICGGILLFSTPDKKTEKTRPEEEMPEPETPSVPDPE